MIKISFRPTLVNMALCMAFVVYARCSTGDLLFEVGTGALDKSQSFSFWRNVYQLARDVQGKLNNFNLLIATNVKRDENGMLTPEAEELLAAISCYS